jgi:iron complex transport system substrate-binding protein
MIARLISIPRVFLVMSLLGAVLVIAGCQSRSADDSDAAIDPTPTLDAATETAEEGDDQTVERDDADADDDTGRGVDPDDDVEADDDVQAGESADYPVTVTRTDGTELTIEQAPQRIVSLSPGATETFFAINAGSQLVAVDMFSDYPEEATELPQLDAYQPDPEAILDLDPDLVFVVYDADGLVDLLDDLGVSVLFLDAPGSLDELIEHVRLLGEVTGNVEPANELAESMQDRTRAILDLVDSEQEGPRIYHELDDMLFTIGPGSFIGDLYELLGAENIADGAMGDYPQLSEEIILERNPEVIILPSYGQDGLVESVRERPGWDSVEAVQNERIYEIDGDIVSRPGPRVVDALEELAELLYPELFESSYGFTIGQSINRSLLAA